MFRGETVNISAEVVAARQEEDVERAHGAHGGRM